MKVKYRVKKGLFGTTYLNIKEVGGNKAEQRKGCGCVIVVLLIISLLSSLLTTIRENSAAIYKGIGFVILLTIFLGGIAAIVALVRFLRNRRAKPEDEEIPQPDADYRVDEDSEK